MDFQKEREAFEKECRLLCYKGNMVMSNLGGFYNNEQTNWMWQMWLSSKAQTDQKIKLLLCDEHLKKCESPTGVFNSQYPDEEPCLICLAKEAKAQAVPEGFVLVKKRNMIGNPNVDWLQAPKWAKYWLKDGHSNKFWWSSIRPVKDMDMNAFCWKGDYFAKKAPDFSYSGPWDKSLTSRKAMIEAQEPADD